MKTILSNHNCHLSGVPITVLNLKDIQQKKPTYFPLSLHSNAIIYYYYDTSLKLYSFMVPQDAFCISKFRPDIQEEFVSIHSNAPILPSPILLNFNNPLP